MKSNPTYTLQPKMIDDRFQVYIVELDITVKTDTTNLDKALNQANTAILEHLEKQHETAQATL